MSRIALSHEWEIALEKLRFAFQPIVQTSDGRAFGYEALLRGWKEAGFPSIESVFDAAFIDAALSSLDIRLRAKALADFAAWSPPGAKLFYNVDNRIFRPEDDAMDETSAIVASLGLSPSRMVLEISERHEVDGGRGFERVVSLCRAQGFRIAIDDFGSGYAGLKLLHASQPDIVKIDRHFVSGSGNEPRKAAFLEKIVGMAHLMGVTVVAEGVETEAELDVCVEAGVDMVQGFFLAKPAIGPGAFAIAFPAMAKAGREARRGRSKGAGVAASSIKGIVPARLSDGFLDLLSRFRKEVDIDILPVVDAEDEPVGVYFERDFRPYVYSPYGIALLEHLETATGASSFLRKAPVAAIGADISRLLEAFGALPSSGGVLLTRDSRYAGIVPAAELLALVAERELAEARDQNPLTRLPGNLRVAEVISLRMADASRGRAFVYFDFDNFKPFNDRYGFRLGDRVIQLFADILRSTFGREGRFVGHLGGDDFFAFACESSLEEAMAPVREAVERFRREASSFYSAEDRERGWILGRDRAEVEREIPLIGVSAAVVFVAAGSGLEPESLSDMLASLKKEAKSSISHTASRIVETASRVPSGGMGPAFAVFVPALISSM